MAILSTADSQILIHGISSPLAQFQCQEMLRHGKCPVGVVTSDPEDVEYCRLSGVPIFPSAHDAVTSGNTNISMIFTPPLGAKTEIFSAIAANVATIICMTEHVPVHDAIVTREAARKAGVRLLGPNSSGMLSPGRVKAGFFVEDICMPGHVGVVTKSGSLAYAVLAEMKSAGVGISTVVAIGGDLVKGTDFRDILALFERDPETNAIVMLGEIGGSDEERAATFIREQRVGKPIVAFISGRSVPLGQSMGHAGAIAQKGRGDYASKVNALAAAGVRVVRNIGEIPLLLKTIAECR